MSVHEKERFAVPEHIRRIRPYQPGRPPSDLEAALGRPLVHLASNENPYGPAPSGAAALETAARDAHLYPDGGGFFLREAIAERFGVSPANVVLGNGSGELVHLLCQGFVTDGERVVTSELAFIQYLLSAQAVNAEVIRLPARQGDLRCDLEAHGEAAQGARMVFIDNPNNPTGTYVTRRELDAYFERVSDSVMTVIDQAYQEYIDVPDYPNAVDDLRAGRNVFVLGTFSKMYGLAGARIGFGLGPEELVTQLEGARLPFNTNALGQSAALASLSDEAFVADCREKNIRELRHLTEGLRERGVRVLPSIANFLLARFETDAKTVFEALRAEGILVRPMAGYGLLHDLRITVGDRDQNDAMLAALDRLDLR